MEMQTEYDIPPELKETIPGYISRRDTDIQSLKIFLQNHDYESIKKLGHKLKGNGASFGFNKISSYGALMMTAAESRDAETLKGVIEDLEAEVQNIKRVVS